MALPQTAIVQPSRNYPTACQTCRFEQFSERPGQTTTCVKNFPHAHQPMSFMCPFFEREPGSDDEEPFSSRS